MWRMSTFLKQASTRFEGNMFLKKQKYVYVQAENENMGFGTKKSRIKCT